MAYEETEVPVSKSQDAIKKLVYAHKGTGLMLISRPPSEGFEAFIEIDMPYHVRIMATCRTFKPNGFRYKDGYQKAIEQEERRVWRVLYWHLKALFEAADSGVIDIRNVVMPYVVLRDGLTLADHVRPKMNELMTMNPSRLLAAESVEQ